MQPISFDQAQNYRVNRSQEYEVTRQSLYDFQTYDTAGQTSLTFFQTPLGQSGKTIADTNLEVAGSLPAPKYFLVESIEIHLFPAEFPVQINNAAAVDAVLTNFSNDVYEVAKGGALDFFIGSKSYLQEAPLGRFPPKTRLNGWFGAALQTKQAIAADDGAQIVGDYAAFGGRPYFLDPYKILLAPTQNFNVRLTWPSAVAISDDARIGVVLDGLLYRLSQ